MQATAPQANMVATTTQTTSAARAKLALGLEWVRIPFPLLRLVAIPGSQEVTTETQFFAAPQPPVAMQTALTAAPQGFVGVPAGMTTAVQPGAMALAAPAPAQLAVPVALTQSQPAFTGVATMAAPTQFVAVPAQPCDSGASNKQRMTKEQLEELTKQVQALEKMINSQAPAQDDKKGGQK
jgi:hypothetical protein